MTKPRQCKIKRTDGTFEVKEIPSYFKITKTLGALDASVQPRFQRFIERAKAAGLIAQINSIRRSPKHQWVLYMFPTCTGALQPEAPCYSNHQYGFAADIAFFLDAAKKQPCKHQMADGTDCINAKLKPIADMDDVLLTPYGWS